MCGSFDDAKKVLPRTRLATALLSTHNTAEREIEKTKLLTKASPHSLVVRQRVLCRGPLASHDLHVRRLFEGKLAKHSSKEVTQGVGGGSGGVGWVEKCRQG